MVNSAEQVPASAQLPNNKFDVIFIVQALAVLNVAQVYKIAIQKKLTKFHKVSPQHDLRLVNLTNEEECLL